MNIFFSAGWMHPSTRVITQESWLQDAIRKLVNQPPPHKLGKESITTVDQLSLTIPIESDFGKSWFLVEKIGEENSYPSLAIDDDGTLHLAYRKKSNRWHMCYRNKRVEHAWEEEIIIATSPTPGYNHFMQSLSVMPDGTLHLTFQFHYAESGLAQDCKGRAVLHIQSLNQGKSWFSSKQAYEQPITIDSMEAVCTSPNKNLRRHNLRIGNHVPPIPKGNGKLSGVCFFTTVPDNPHGRLWYQNQTRWEYINLPKLTSELNVYGGKSTSISRDFEGNVHLVNWPGDGMV